MKNNILLILIFLSGMVCGGFIGGKYVMNHTSAPASPAVCAASAQPADLLLAQLEDAALPQDVTEAENEQKRVHSASEIPSQLVRTDLPDGIVLGGKPENPTPEKPAGIELNDAQNTVVLQAQKPANRVADNTSSITMIEAPVEIKRIQTLDGYKEFKHTARGSYPAADFSKEEVIVLESQSNLPDKAFEIVEIIPGEKEIKVLYRVNLFGLDKKTNTHSAQKISKSKLPAVLEQVL